MKALGRAVGLWGNAILERWEAQLPPDLGVSDEPEFLITSQQHPLMKTVIQILTGNTK